MMSEVALHDNTVSSEPASAAQTGKPAPSLKNCHNEGVLRTEPSTARILNIIESFGRRSEGVRADLKAECHGILEAASKALVALGPFINEYGYFEGIVRKHLKKLNNDMTRADRLLAWSSWLPRSSLEGRFQELKEKLQETLRSLSEAAAAGGMASCDKAVTNEGIETEEGSQSVHGAPSTPLAGSATPGQEPQLENQSDASVAPPLPSTPRKPTTPQSPTPPPTDPRPTRPPQADPEDGREAAALRAELDAAHRVLGSHVATLRAAEERLERKFNCGGPPRNTAKKLGAVSSSREAAEAALAAVLRASHKVEALQEESTAAREAAQAQVDAAHVAERAAEAAAAALRRGREAAEAAAQDAQQQLRAAEEEAAALRRGREAAEAAAQEAQQQLRAAEEEAAALRQGRETAEAAAQEAQQQLRAAEEEAAALRRGREAAEAAAQNAQQQLRAATEEAAALHQGREAAEAAAQDAQQQLRAAAEEAAALRRGREAAEAAAQNAQQQLRAAAEEAAALHQGRESAEAAAQDAQQQLRAAAEEAAALCRGRETAEAAAQEAQQQLRAAEEEAAALRQGREAAEAAAQDAQQQLRAAEARALEEVAVLRRRQQEVGTEPGQQAAHEAQAAREQAEREAVELRQQLQAAQAAAEQHATQYAQLQQELQAVQAQAQQEIAALQQQVAEAVHAAQVPTMLQADDPAHRDAFERLLVLYRMAFTPLQGRSQRLALAAYLSEFEDPFGGVTTLTNRLYDRLQRKLGGNALDGLLVQYNVPTPVGLQNMRGTEKCRLAVQNWALVPLRDEATLSVRLPNLRRVGAAILMSLPGPEV